MKSFVEDVLTTSGSDGRPIKFRNSDEASQLRDLVVAICLFQEIGKISYPTLRMKLERRVEVVLNVFPEPNVDAAESLVSKRTVDGPNPESVGNPVCKARTCDTCNWEPFCLRHTKEDSWHEVSHWPEYAARTS